MDAFDLMFMIGLDKSGFDKGLSSAGGEAEGFGSKIGGVFKTAGKVAAVGLGAAVTAVGALTKAAVTSYSDHQQLWGGIQKLYGNAGLSVQKYAQMVGKSTDQVRAKYQANAKVEQTVLQNANNAYKTAGMSANQYMETATQFSASLINSLGGNTAKAAKMTDVAIQAMSDNANTFGTNIDSISETFVSLSRGNYAMLDNLKLGYAGTKKGLQELVKDANAYGKSTGQAANLSADNFADVVQAIQLVQEKQHIAGTTAREGAKTVEGSINQLKGAWTNLISGLGDPDADIGKLSQNVVTSLGHVVDNVGPVIMQAMDGIGKMLPDLVTNLMDKIPGLIQTYAPKLITAAFNLIGAIATALPGMLAGIAQAIPGMLETVFTSVKANLQSAFSGLFDSDIGSKIGEKIKSLIAGIGPLIATELPKIAQTIGTALSNFGTYLQQNGPAIMASVLQLLGNIASGIIQALPGILSGIIHAIPPILSGLFSILKGLIVTLVGGLFSGLGSLIKTLGNGIKSAVSSIWNGIKSVTTSVWNGIKSVVTSVWNAIKSAVTSGANAVKSVISRVWNGIKSVTSSVWNAIKGAITKPLNAAKGAATAAANAIKNGVTAAFKAAKSTISSVWSGIKNVIIKPLASAASSAIGKAKAIATGIVNGLKTAVSQVGAIGKNIIQGLWNGASGMVSWAVGKFKGLGKSILNGIKSVLGIHSPSKVMADEVGKNIALGLVQGMEKATGQVTKASNKLAASIISSVDKTTGSGKKKRQKALKDYQNDIVSATDKRIKELEKANKITDKQEAALWASIGRRLKKGTTAYATAMANIKNTQKNAYKDMMDKATKRLDNYEVYHKTSLSFEAAYWNVIRKQFKKGSEQRIEADKNYFDKRKELREQEKTAEKTLADAVAEAEKTYQDAIDATTKKLTDRRDEIVKSRDIFSAFDAGESQSMGTLIANMQSQANATKEWTEDMAKLKGRIKNTDLLKILYDKGVDGLKDVRTLVSATDSELATWEESFTTTLQGSAMDEARLELGDEVKKDMDDALDTFTTSIKKAYSDYGKSMNELGKTVTDMPDKVKASLDKSVTSYSDALKNMGLATDESMLTIFQTVDDKLKQTADKSKRWGKDIIAQLVSGIESKMSTLRAAVEAAAQTVKDNLGFSEPKRGPLSDFHTYAPDMMKLFAKGITDNTGVVDDAMQAGLGLPAQEMSGALTQTAGSGLAGQLSSILATLQQYMPQMANQKIVMDTGALVGATAGGMDNELARISSRRRAF